MLHSPVESANVAGLGLVETGVLLETGGGVRVDEFGCSSVPSIYAAGDVTDRVALTPVAIRDGAAIANTLFGARRTAIDRTLVPSAVFSQPPIGTVGLSESKALDRYGEIDIYRADFRPLKHTLSGRNERTLVKLVVDTASQRVLGAHMVGADAPEIIQGLAIALHMKATKADFDATLAIHPTSAEEFVTLTKKTTRKKKD